MDSNKASNYLRYSLCAQWTLALCSTPVFNCSWSRETFEPPPIFHGIFEDIPVQIPRNLHTPTLAFCSCALSFLPQRIQKAPARSVFLLARRFFFWLQCVNQNAKYIFREKESGNEIKRTRNWPQSIEVSNKIMDANANRKYNLGRN